MVTPYQIFYELLRCKAVMTKIPDDDKSWKRKVWKSFKDYAILNLSALPEDLAVKYESEIYASSTDKKTPNRILKQNIAPVWLIAVVRQYPEAFPDILEHNFVATTDFMVGYKEAAVSRKIDSQIALLFWLYGVLDTVAIKKLEERIFGTNNSFDALTGITVEQIRKFPDEVYRLLLASNSKLPLAFQEPSDLETSSVGEDNLDQYVSPPSTNVKPHSIRTFGVSAILAILAGLTIAYAGGMFRGVVVTSSPLDLALTALKENERDAYIANLITATENEDPIASIALAVAYGIGFGVVEQPDLARRYVDAANKAGLSSFLGENPVAQYFWGLRHYHGIATPENIPLALSFWRDARVGGYTRASLQIALHSQDTTIIEDDCNGMDEAKIAHDAGHIVATELLADMHNSDFCKPKSPKTARALYLQAADAGLIHSKTELARMLEAGAGGPQNEDAAFLLYLDAAEAGDMEAQYSIGWMYFYGKGVDQSDEEALKSFKAAASQGSVAAKEAAGWVLYVPFRAPDDYEEAAKWNLDAAKHGSSMAQLSYGLMLIRGHGVKEDPVEARKWFRLSADQGRALAKYNLAFDLMKARGGPSDEPEAFLLMHEAAKTGIAAAENWLGIMFRDGIGTDPNPESAKHWFEIATLNGNEMAPSNLSRYFLTEGSNEQDIAEGLKLLALSGERGHTAAINQLGDIYFQGDVVKQNFAKAFDLFQEAANEGDAWAQHNLGLMYENGQNVDPNIHEAVRWYRESALQDNSRAQNSLGWLYGRNEELGIDHDEEFNWTLRAAKNGDPIAQTNLGHLFLSGTGVDESYPDAQSWFEMAAEQNDARAQYTLGLMYQNGLGVEPDVDDAVSWFKVARSNGNSDASISLGWIYLTDEGPWKNEADGIAIFSSAISTGNSNGNASLGLAFLYGIGVQQSDDTALSLCSNAYPQNSFTDFCLGALYIKLEGSPYFRSPHDAERALAYAADDGIGWAANLLGTAHAQNFFDVAISDAEAHSWFLRAIDLGVIDAKYNYALFLLRDEPTFHSNPTALNFLEEAAATGHSLANELLAAYNLGVISDHKAVFSASTYLSRLVEKGQISVQVANDISNSPEAFLSENIVIQELGFEDLGEGASLLSDIARDPDIRARQ